MQQTREGQASHRPERWALLPEGSHPHTKGEAEQQRANPLNALSGQQSGRRTKPKTGQGPR
jgi:hypothetical protein